METDARAAATSPTWMSAVLSMPPVYRSGRRGPLMDPDGRGLCDGCDGSLRRITGSPSRGSRIGDDDAAGAPVVKALPAATCATGVTAVARRVRAVTSTCRPGRMLPMATARGRRPGGWGGCMFGVPIELLVGAVVLAGLALLTALFLAERSSGRKAAQRRRSTAGA